MNYNSDNQKKYKKVEIMNYKQNSLNNLPIFKSPIRTFVINKHLDYKNNLITQFKNSKIKTLNLKHYNNKRNKKKN